MAFTSKTQYKILTEYFWTSHNNDESFRFKNCRFNIDVFLHSTSHLISPSAIEDYTELTEFNLRFARLSGSLVFHNISDILSLPVYDNQ